MERNLDIVNHIYAILTENGKEVQKLADFFLESRDHPLSMFLYDNLDISKRDSNIINRENGNLLSYEAFARAYMEPNLPVVFQSGMVDDWKASKLWKNENGPSSINFQYLCEEFGKNQVEVHVQQSAGFASKKPCRIQMSVEEYIWQYADMAVLDGERYYLKDWKFVVQNPLYNAYACPKFFEDDWLNDSMKDSYKFVYCGPQGTITGLHADVLYSYSWSANVAGRKRWHLIPPKYTVCLFDIFGQRLSPHLNYTDNLVMFPRLSIAREHAIEVIQEEGETIFVPSGWYHQVENLETTLSINHNWINGFNIKWSWQRISRELKRYVERNSKSEGLEEDSGSSNGNINDDLMIFWLMLQRKVESMSVEKYRYSDISTLDGLSMHTFNLNELRELLIELVSFVEQGYDFDVPKQCKWSAQDMLMAIDNQISSLRSVPLT